MQLQALKILAFLGVGSMTNDADYSLDLCAPIFLSKIQIVVKLVNEYPNTKYLVCAAS